MALAIAKASWIAAVLQLVVVWLLVQQTYALPYLQCEPIAAQECRALNANYTHARYPNAYFTTQSEASLQFATFTQLIHSRCSPMLSVFLCSYYYPACLEQQIHPCRSLCQEVRSGCEPLLIQNGLQWPSYFECSRFTTEQPCIAGIAAPAPPSESPSTTPSVATTSSSETTSTTASTGTTTQTDSSSSTPTTDSPPTNFTMPTDLFRKQCQPVSNSKCSSLHPAYQTYFPHKNYVSQDLAELQFNSFELLSNSNCSEHLDQFLCLGHFPACVEEGSDVKLIYPCTDLCEEVKSSCEPLLIEHGYSWPEYLKCDSFLNKNDHLNVCADASFGDTQSTPSPTTATTPTSEPTSSVYSNCESLQPRVKDICGGIHEHSSYTKFPNGQFQTQDEAYTEFSKWIGLISVNCSAEMRAFLCFHYFPPCSEDGLATPCRSVCRKAHTKCESCLKQVDIDWSDHFDCQKFRVRGTCTSLSDLRRYLNLYAPHEVQCSETVTVPTAPPTDDGCPACTIGDNTSAINISQSGHDFVSSIRVLTEVKNGAVSYYTAVVEQFLQSAGAITVKPFYIVHTDSTDECPCPKLQVGSKYLIAGYFGDNNVLRLPRTNSIVQHQKES